jgi:hypothetical protein
MFDTLIDQSSHRSRHPATAALLAVTHLILAIAIGLTALFGNYAGGDWRWWLDQASIRKMH